MPARSSGTQREMDVGPVAVQKFLSGISYPATKQELIKHAKDKGAPSNVLQFMEQMDDSTFKSPVDVSRALGKLT